LRAVFFDLDYTLYDHRQYLRGALADVAHSVATACRLGDERAYGSLLRLWEQTGTDYGFLFNDWLKELQLFSPVLVKRCVAVFHAHQPKVLRPYPAVDQTLSYLRNKYTLGLITDGNVTMQATKLRALHLDERFDLIVYADALSLTKPDPRVFRHALREAGVSPAEATHVGDHPVKDIVGARRAGLPAVRVMTGEFSNLADSPGYPPTVQLPTISELRAVIESGKPPDQV